MKYLIISLLILKSVLVFAQKPGDKTLIFKVVKPVNNAIAVEEIFTIPEQMPVFPGGEAALFNYLSKNISYPADARANGIQGTVFISFVINQNGSVVNPRVVRGVSQSLNDEALRVMLGMPDWIPGRNRGVAVNVQYNLPIIFTLN
ncbi:MAG: energy transducer TonB [Bacteroidetes bacterium]|nr:energy transducer TonB [Bacteroidota bacterium]